MKKEKKKEYQRYYLAYSAAVTGLFCVILLIFQKNGKSFIRGGDGLGQHYVALEYWGKYLRRIVKGILLEHRLNIPQWDLHIGYGADILTTLHYYVIGDPLNLLAVFVPAAYMEYLYGFLCFLRYYLAGITFSMYCFYHKNGKLPVLLGSLIYVYSQWMIVTGLEHPYFMNPCIYLPLIMLGVDRIFDGKKPYFYIWSIVLSAVSNFYFFYMLGIFTVIYAVFRYFTRYQKIRLKELAPVLGKFCLYSVIALMISAFILAPVVKVMMGNSRMSTERYMPILYSKRFYFTLLAAFAGGNNKTRFSYIGAACVCVSAVAVLFMQKGKYRSLKAGTLLVAAMACIPLAGRIMNGFSYTTNRWTWAAGMLWAYIFVKMFPEFFHLSRRKRIVLALVAGLYGSYLTVFGEVRSSNNTMAGILLFLFIVIFSASYQVLIRDRRKMALFLAAFLTVSVGTNIWFYYTGSGRGSSEKEHIISAYVDRGTVASRCHTKVEKALKRLPDSSEFRFDQKYMEIVSNNAMLNDLNGGKFRFSIAPEGLGTFFNEICMSNFMEQSIFNLNSRSWLSKIFSVKYFVSRKGIAPYGFVKETKKAGQKKRAIYKDEDALPLAYTYDNYIPVKEYEKMNAIEKQEALLQSVVLGEKDAQGLKETRMESHTKELPYTVREMENMTWENGVIEAKKGGSCVLEFQGEKNCETYVTFTDIFYKGKNKVFRPLFEEKDCTNGKIKIRYPHNGKTISQTIQVLSVKDNFSSGRTNYGTNLLYQEEPVSEIKLEFRSPGKYKVKDIQIFSQTMGGISEFSEKRREEAPQDLKIDGGHISCSVDFSRERELVFSIPYSTGWSLTVDGVKQDTNKANRMFLGAKISEGSHQIELHYTTPGLPEGVTISLVGLFCLGILWKRELRKKRYDLQ